MWEIVSSVQVLNLTFADTHVWAASSTSTTTSPDLHG
jgi:hypothetical protein